MFQGRSGYHSGVKSLSLPVDEHRRAILYLLEKNRVLIIVGETGSGKSTRIPLFLYKSGKYNVPIPNQPSQNRVICVTQPRRVAAIQLAQRVSQDLGCSLGSKVGYAVRFDEAFKEGETHIKFMTDGLLLREILFDPLLSKYSVIMVDEAHERNINSDILLGLLKCILAKRLDLKIIISSATLNVAELANFFRSSNSDQNEETCSIEPSIISIEGKTHPIRIYYKTEPVVNYMDAAYDTVVSIHESLRLASGKILIFLTGQDEVEYVGERLLDYSQTISNRLELRKLLVLPLHASLRSSEISKIFEDYGTNTRACIVSTNVAETSITIDDVAFVIDCGFVKLKVHDTKTGIDHLVRLPISKSSANQRAGRAGRTRGGKVYRLYSEEDYEKLDEATRPELERLSLLEPFMLLKSLGVSRPQLFPLLSPMPRKNLAIALELLFALGAIDESGQLTAQGEIMCQLNLDPRLSKVLVSQETSSCTIEACRFIAMLQVKEIFKKPGRYASKLWSNTSLCRVCVSEGDIPSYLNIMNGFLSNNKSQRWAEKRSLNYNGLMDAVNISNKLERQLTNLGIKLISARGRLDTIRRSLTSGLFSNAAYLHPSGDYRTIRGDKIVHIHPLSVLSELIDRPKYVLFVEILNTTKSFMRHVTAIEPDWLLESAPHYYSFATSLEIARQKPLADNAYHRRVS